MTDEYRSSAEVAADIEQLQARLDEIVERHPKLVAHLDRTREEHAEAIAEGRPEETVGELARRSAELDERVYGERRASELLVARIEAAEEEHEAALVREAEVRYREALSNLRAKAEPLIEWLVGQAQGGELGKLCASLEAAFESAVGAERARLGPPERVVGSRPSAALQLLSDLGLQVIGRPVIWRELLHVPIRVQEAAERAERRRERAERKREHEERQGEPVPESEPPEGVAEEAEPVAIEAPA